MALQQFISQPTVKFAEFQIVNKDARPSYGNTWIVKQIDGPAAFVFSIEEYSDRLVINNDSISQDFFLQQICASIFENRPQKLNIQEYQDIYLIDDVPTRIAVEVPDFTIASQCPKLETELFLNGSDIHSCLYSIMSFDKELENLGFSCHHGLLTTSNLMRISNPTTESSMKDSSIWKFKNFYYASFRFREASITAYPAMPQTQITGACNMKHLIAYDVSSDGRYYSFSNPKQYILECQRGTIGRLAFSESQAFRTIDVYLLIISICCNLRYRDAFFGDPNCVEIWNSLWSSDRVPEYPEIVKRQLFESRYCNISSEDHRKSDVEKQLWNCSLNFLANRPLKTFF